MIDTKIISRLEDLKYLGKTKGANVSIVSKKSEYHDIVKFYAQINTDNRIQKISFQASGCTTFMAMCSFFCELIQGMKVSSALKVTKDDLDKFVKVDSSSYHVYPIIFDTFQLLIKKYNKGIESGKIVPAEVVENVGKKEKSSSLGKKSTVVDKTLEKYLENSKTPKVNNIKVVVVENSDQSKEDNVSANIDKSSKSKNDKKVSQKSQQNKEIKETQKSQVKTRKKTTKNKERVVSEDTSNVSDLQIIPNENSDEITMGIDINTHETPNVMEEAKVIKVVEVKEEIQVKHTEDSVEMTKTKKTNEIHLGHLSSLQEKLKTKESHDKSQSNLHSLNSLLHKMEGSKDNNIEIDTEIVIEETPKVSGKKEKTKKEKTKKEGKSFFSWFRRK